MSTFQVRTPVRTTAGRATHWLGADGKAVDDESKALILTFRLFPTMGDLLRIERRVDYLNGGIGETVDLDVAIDRLHTTLRRRYEAQLWPDGRPAAATNEEAIAQEDAIGFLFAAEGKDRHVLDRMHALRDRQRMLAEWPILIVSPPPGWEDPSERALPVPYQEALVTAYTLQRGEAEAAAGK